MESITEYKIRNLDKGDFVQMHRTFMESFADYPVPYSLTLDQFTRKMLNKVNINWDCSLGVFSSEKLVAFVFHSLNLYEGQLMAYNAGTGVIPGHRNLRLTFEMYRKVVPILIGQEVKSCVLEVLEKNEIAQKAYRKVGFQETKKFAYFQLKDKMKKMNATHQVIKVTNPDLNEYKTIEEHESSFGDTRQQLAHNLSNETALEVRFGDELVGYLIYQALLGRVTRFAVKKEYRNQGLGTSLFIEAKKLTEKPLTVININRDYGEVISFLESIGFVNTLDQFEMQLKLE